MIFRIILLLFFINLPTSSAQAWNSGKICSSKFQRCYQYFEDLVTFNEAENRCVELGGHLVSIRDFYENKFVWHIGEVQTVSILYWFGANNLTGSWKWTDGSPFGYTNWIQPPTELCATQSINNGVWLSVGCENRLPFVCDVPRTTGQITSCDIGWTYLPTTDSCYKVYHNANWNDSETACIALGAHLASIHSESENTFINDLSSSGKNFTFNNDLTWIGLQNIRQEWVWTDGSKTDFFNWAPKQPDNLGKELCVQTASDLSYYKWDREWNNLNCNTVMRAYVCKKPSNRS